MTGLGVARQREGWLTPAIEPGRVWLWTRVTSTTFRIALAGVVLLFVLRLPFLSPTLANWDSAQFALGTLNYNIGVHQPHPPGYILYIASGALLNTFTGDPNLSLTLMSALGAAVATVGFGLLVSRMNLRPEVVVLSIIAFGASPLLWYYSTVALTYAPDAAFAVLIGLCSWQAIRKRSGSWLILAAVFLAVAGGFRQTTEILLFPLWALAALYVRPRWQVLVGLVVLAAVTAMWVIPLFVLAGGPEAYFRYSRELAETISSGSTVIFQGASAFAVNGVMVLFAAAAGIGAAIILGMFALPHLPSLVRRLHMDRRVLFVLAWIGPAAAVYAFGHIGQPGYVLVALPALLLLVLGPLSHVIRKQARPMVLTAALLALLIGGNVWAFTEGRHLVSGVLSSEAPATIALRDAMMWQAPQFGMVPTDRDWRGIQALVADYQPGEVIVLTGTDVLSNFRHAAFYLPEQKVYSVAVGPGGGKFFEAVRHQSDYSIAGFNYPTVRVDVPSTARAILIVENYLAEALRTGRPIEQIRFDDGSMVHWINLDGRPESLFFEDTIVLSNVPTFEERTFGDEEAVESMAAIKLERLQEQNAGAAE